LEFLSKGKWFSWFFTSIIVGLLLMLRFTLLYGNKLDRVLIGKLGLVWSGFIDCAGIIAFFVKPRRLRKNRLNLLVNLEQWN
jgi:hypothetical protein